MGASTPERKISSSFTACYKIGGFLAGVMLLIGSIPLANFNLLPGVCVGFGALFALTVWWKYLRPASEVALNNEGLEVLDNDKRRILYREILSVSRRPGLVVQTVVVRYKDPSGLHREISFIPSIREGGFLLTAEHIQQMIEQRMTGSGDQQAIV